MIKSEGGQLRMQGKKDELKLEYMQMLDAIKKSGLFSSDAEFEEMTMFVVLDENQQRECIVEMLDDMIKSLEKVKE